MPTAIIIDDSGSTGLKVKNFTILDVVTSTAKKLLSNHSDANVFSMTDLSLGTAKPLSINQISALQYRYGTPLYQAIAQAFEMGYDRFYVICDGMPNGGDEYPAEARFIPSQYATARMTMPPISSIATILVVEEAEQLHLYFQRDSPNFFTQTTIAIYVADKL